MNAKEYLNIALGGNMNFGTLKPLAIEEIMEGYAVHKFNVLNQYKIAREKSSEMIDDMLLQEIYSLQEKIKIITKMLKQFEPDLDIPMFLHALGHCDYEEWKDGCKENEDSINGVQASAHNSDYAVAVKNLINSEVDCVQTKNGAYVNLDGVIDCLNRALHDFA